MSSVKVLDCTLRDGGHVNKANFGETTIKEIIQGLCNARIDYIELGFLMDGQFSRDQSTCNTVEEMCEYIPDNIGDTKFTAMIRPDWYDISQLSNDKQKIDIIRFAFYIKDFKLTERYANIVKNRGYGVICNPVNIMQYSEQELSELCKMINSLQPEQMTMVDTYGSMNIEDLKRKYDIIENNLMNNIRVGLHTHENQSLAYGLVQKFLEIKEPERNVVIDSSILGMGRMPGNLCTEIITSHINNFISSEYDENEIYRIIADYIGPLKEEYGWGYNPAYYLTGKMNMHRSYAEYLIKKGLNSYEILNALNMIPVSERAFYSENVIEEIFNQRRF